MKTLENLCAEIRRRPRNVRWKELEKLMDMAGFDIRLTKSAHGAVFHHRVYPTTVSAAKPRQGKPVLETYIWDCLNAIDDVAQLAEDTDA